MSEVVKEIAWVFGNSASGKETFIRRLAEARDATTLQLFGWEGKNVVASLASVAHIGHYEGDPVTRQREDILSEVPLLLRDADVALIKWQGVDSGAHRVERLQTILPDFSHRIIQLVATDEELAHRLPRKPWWIESDDVVQFIANEHRGVANCMAALNGAFPVTQVRSSSGDYSVIDL